MDPESWISTNPGEKLFIVQRAIPTTFDEWTDVDQVAAVDASEALMKALRNPSFHAVASTHRVVEHHLSANLSINLTPVEPPAADKDVHPQEVPERQVNE